MVCVRRTPFLTMERAERTTTVSPRPGCAAPTSGRSQVAARTPSGSLARPSAAGPHPPSTTAPAAGCPVVGLPAWLGNPALTRSLKTSRGPTQLERPYRHRLYTKYSPPSSSLIERSHLGPIDFGVVGPTRARYAGTAGVGVTENRSDTSGLTPAVRDTSGSWGEEIS